ncbi:MAG: glycosyltransferase [Thermoanaerobacterales bacterium]|jgi:D-inositol-3-phosphate glycosyltransferase|nr:glycosyltransferase family 1 protein [Thermoanaerobacterales bacterium]
MVRRLAVLSLHTSPLAQPGAGDSGGMNVYVRELVSALAQAGVQADVYTRRWADGLPEVVEVEPGFRVVHVPAGPTDLTKEELPEVVDEFADGVLQHLVTGDDLRGVDALHANYWLSGVAGHRLKHELDLPLVSTFHTLARVKAETGDPEPRRRIEAETAVIGCSDVILANSAAEATQLQQLYGADPDRIEIVPPGVVHAFFSPGDRAGARAALPHLGPGDGPMLLFVGRIQPLKGLDVAVRALAELDDPTAVLVVVGGPSGADGVRELERVEKLAAALGVAERVRFADPQPHHLLSSYYRAADVVLVPSRSESFGLVALEAAACGTPVVAAAVGGLRTLVEHGRTGFLVEQRDPRAYAAHAAQILANPPLAAALSAAAARRARDYTWSTTAARLRRIYADLAARTPATCEG